MLKNLSLLLPTKLLYFLYFIYRHKHIPRFRWPRSLSEKINNIKLYNKTPLREKIVDRKWVRNYVANLSNSVKFPALLYSGVVIDPSTFDRLPSRFFMKANHGSGMAMLVDKKKHTYEKIHNTINLWMSKSYANYGREWFYEKLDKYILIEELLEDDGTSPPDFKFFCTSGKVVFIQVDLDRFTNHTRNLYWPDFTRISGTLLYPTGYDFEKPILWDEAIKIAEQLSVDLDFVRVDLYLHNDSIYFGELTNSPGNGFEPFQPREFDFKLGAMFPDLITR